MLLCRRCAPYKLASATKALSMSMAMKVGDREKYCSLMSLLADHLVIECIVPCTTKASNHPTMERLDDVPIGTQGPHYASIPPPNGKKVEIVCNSDMSHQFRHAPKKPSFLS